MPELHLLLKLLQEDMLSFTLFLFCVLKGFTLKRLRKIKVIVAFWVGFAHHHNQFHPFTHYCVINI